MRVHSSVALVALVALLCSPGSAQYTEPYKMTFASADPEGALEFAVKYLGATQTPQPHVGGNGRCALIKWCVFRGTSPYTFGIDYQFHFVKGYHRPNGSMTIDAFENRMAALHGDFSRPDARYDQYMDFHATLYADDLDTIAAKLVADGRPLLARKSADGASASIFVELPHAIFVEITGPSLTVVTPAPWSRCGAPVRPIRTDRAAALRRIASARAHASGMAKSPVRPLRAVYASSSPKEAADFVAWAFGGERTSEPEALPGNGNGTCYDAQAVRWTSPSGASTYELMWIRSPRQPQGSLTLAQYEEYLRALHGDISRDVYDEYMDNHVALIFNDGDDVIRCLDEASVPYFMRGQYGAGADVFIEGPQGQIYELLARKQSLKNNISSWDLCGPVALDGDKVSTMYQ